MNALLKTTFRLANPLVRRLLRSRFHWPLSRSVVLLEVVGRRSGRLYLVPASYTPFDGGVSVMTYRRRLWWRNIETGHEIPVYLQGRRTMVVPEVIVDDPQAIATALADRSLIRKLIARPAPEHTVLIRLRHLPPPGLGGG